MKKKKSLKSTKKDLEGFIQHLETMRNDKKNRYQWISGLFITILIPVIGKLFILGNSDNISNQSSFAYTLFAIILCFSEVFFIISLFNFSLKKRKLKVTYK